MLVALLDVTLRRLVLADVTGQSIGSILKGHSMQEEGFLDILIIEYGKRTETSVCN